MANKKQKITIGSLKAYVDKVSYDEPKIIDIGDGSLIVKPRLTLKEMGQFVVDSVSSCFINEDRMYAPEVKDFVINNNILEFYTNAKLPDNIESRFNIVTRCRELILRIMDLIDKRQFQVMIDAIDERINLINDSRLSKVDGQLEELYRAFSDISSQMERLFNGIDADELKNFAGALSNYQIDESKLVSALAGNQRPKDAGSNEA